MESAKSKHVQVFDIGHFQKLKQAFSQSAPGYTERFDEELDVLMLGLENFPFGKFVHLLGRVSDQTDNRGQFPVVAKDYFALYPELDIPPEQLEAFTNNRIGMVVGRELAEQFEWKIGDRIPIQATIWTKADGGRTWEFDLEGIFSTDDPRGSTAYMLFNYDYFEEARAFGKGTAGWYIFKIAAGADPAEVANAVDAQFANSPNETETSTEAAAATASGGLFGGPPKIPFIPEFRADHPFLYIIRDVVSGSVLFVGRMTNP